MRSARQDPGEAVWRDLASRDWRRIRWRRARTPLAPPEGAVCAAFGTPIHRAGTYYVRPAYTDGALWLSQQGYDALIRRTHRARASRRSGERPPGA